MNARDIHDLEVWKANLEDILKEHKTKLEAIQKIIRYAERRPEVVCMIQNFKEQIPDLKKTIDHIEESINAINLKLEDYYEHGKHVNHYKTYAGQTAGFNQERERAKFVQLQTTQALLVN